jgi:hypothetical protein
MSRLVDGPAAGTSLVNARAPWFLRIVIDESGKVDCLDQFEDTPRADERVYVYETVPGTATGPALVRLARPSRCVWMQMGEYHHRPDVDGEQLRETDSWRAWCQAQPREPAS